MVITNKTTGKMVKNWLRKIAALALSAVPLILVWIIVSPLLEIWNDRKTTISEKRILLGRTESIAAYEPRIKQIEKEIALSAGDDPFMHGETAALIEASLLSKIQDISATNGATIINARSANGKNDGTTDWVGVRVNLAGPLPSVYRTVHALEAERPPLLIEFAHIRSQYVQAQGANQDTGLTLQMDVYGAVMSDGPSVKKQAQ